MCVYVCNCVCVYTVYVCVVLCTNICYLMYVDV